MKKQILNQANWQKLLFKKTSDNSGFLLVNKPSGPTSHDIIDKLRAITGIKKIGHAGTLDPFASGLLIVGVGREATREISQFVKLDKTYKTRLKLGYVSNTYDRDGEIKAKSAKCKTQSNSVKLKAIKEVLKHFTGAQEQIPPMFSAKKIKGKKLYELARKGISIKRKPHKIHIFYIKLLKYKWPHTDLEIKCSSGTYIRTLGHDIGKKLGTGAYVEELTRTAIGKFLLKNAVSLA